MVEVQLPAMSLLYSDVQDFWVVMSYKRLVCRPLYHNKLSHNSYPARTGAQVVVPYRDEMEKRHLKVMGDLGQIVPMVGTHMHPLCLLYHSSLGMGRSQTGTNR